MESKELDRGSTQPPRTPLRDMFAIGAISATIGIALALAIDWFPIGAATAAGKIDTLFEVLLSVSVVVFVLVEVVVIYCVWKFRKRPGDGREDGPPIHGNTKLELIWTAVPAAVIAGLCVYAYMVLTAVEKNEPNPLRVRVVSEQFAWSFYYPGKDGKEIASPQLYLPERRQVHFTIQSKDVLHSFWVPAFRLKIDAVPGMNSQLNVTTNRRGQYPVVCAELCGLGHAVMRQTAHVMPSQKFNAWLSKQQSGSGGSGGSTTPGEKPDGKAIFTGDLGCSGCHTLKDAGTNGTVGPNLDTGLQGKSKTDIRESIVDPDKVVTKGYSAGIMPSNFGTRLKPPELTALVDYLAEVAGK